MINQGIGVLLKVLLSLCIAVAVSLAPPARAQGVTSCSTTTSADERVLCHEIAIEAPAAEVWALLTTSEGLRSWMAPVAAIELGVGGMWESSYNSDAEIGDMGNIRNRVIAFVPERLLVIQVAQAPTDFPYPDEVRELTTLLTLEPVDPTHTRVGVTMLGYRDGAAFDALYQFFDAGNAYTLNKLRERVVEGPTDWAREGVR